MTEEKKELKEKWALILGASSGFGAAVGEAMARAGMNILGVHLDRKSTQKNATDLQDKIHSFGRKAFFFNVNASDPEKRTEVIEQFKKEFPNQKIYLLLHSLAFGTLKPFVEDSKQQVNKSQMDMTLDVMANSLVYWTQDLVEHQILEEGGRIYAMTSSGSERVWKTYGAVSAAKSALESHVRQLALELSPLKVTVNAIRAGVTDTPALRKIPGNDQMIEIARNKNPFGRLTTPEDISNCLLSLALPHTYWLTGNVLGVDGGENIVE